MARYTDIDLLIETVEETDWYHISKQGELARGANSKDDIPLYKNSDITKVLNNAPIADVVPRSEVEKLTAELDRKRAGHPFGMTLFELQACEEHAAISAVKEVWRDLRSMCDAPHWCVWLSEIDDYFEKKTGETPEDIEELEMKYTKQSCHDCASQDECEKATHIENYQIDSCMEYKENKE